MTSSLLWSVDVYGKVYSLSTASGRWERTEDSLLELKRVTAGKRCSWGIGCDHHVYLNINPGVEPIRYREETYENQRWNPVDGFTDVLLPTDRWPWSDVTGMMSLPLHSFLLPSLSWEWEGDWYVDQSCGGDPAETGGWEYAVDFPANFSHEKKWNSCVRRRRWFRYRRYKARGEWAKIPLDHPKRPPLPLSDISCGGWEMSDQPGRHHFLWGVSQQGQVWFREGIQPLVPEGSCWEEVEVPRELSQLSAGPGDLLWALLWDGQLLVRTGITLDSPTGISWVVVDAPGKEGTAIHVAVGVGVVWVVTKDYKVWFRRGVNSHNPCGSGWISVGGEMMMVDVGLNDQVWGVSEDRGLYFRMGVTPSEPSGRGWIPILAQWGSSREVAPPSDGPEFGGQVTEASQGSVLGCEDSDLDTFPTGVSSSPSSATIPGLGDTPKPCVPKVTSDSFISSLVSDRERTPAPQLSSPEEPPGDHQEAAPVPSPASPGAAGPEVPWSNVDLQGAEGAQAEGPSLATAGATGPPSSVATYPLGLEPSQGMGEEEGPVWAWITGGGCDVDSSSQISWLSPTGPLTSSLSLTPVQSATWREQEQPRDRSSKRPLERSASVWMRKGSMRWWRDWKPQRWVDVGMALEQSTNSNGWRDSIFFIYYTQYDEKKYLHVFVSEVTALVPVLRDSQHAFAVYTAQRTKQRWPLILAAPTEKDMNDWVPLLVECCCEARGIRGPLSRQALWSVTSKGDVMVHEPSPCLEAPVHTLACDLMFWRQVPGHLRCVECNSLGVVWGVGCDGTAWVYSGRCGESGDQPSQGTTDSVQTQTDVRSVYVYENQRWNPMTGYTDKGLPTDRPMWSDESGLKECTKTNTHPPSLQWTWVTEWTIDNGIPGGTDKEGWQYAADFPVTFHGHKTMKDFVRRRRWARKCQISVIGPWQQIPPIPLSDITILPCLAQSCIEQVPVWAVSDKGDVLCRLGVTPLKPQGTSWLHIGTDQPFKSISIGGANQVWAIARDGAVFYRGSVSAQNPAGECWYHIPSPAKQALKQLSVGRTSVYAVDENSNLWYRQGLTPSYPQGSAWELISNNVTKVSVGPLDQVWIIADRVPGFPSEPPGTVCHRLGVGPMQPKGQSWDYGIGGGWEHISVRGNASEGQRAPPPQATLPASPHTPRAPLPASPHTPRTPLPASPHTPRAPLPASPHTPSSPLPRPEGQVNGTAMSL
ncbi:tectonin beta-propeller repeat-containing protein 1 isoform X2 [Osmerus eperlanus]|uniref:tectonin beta-propeller repeat-containing protein 1 isoform X2 n=1 Tax=Osmerus eperlanus TaxID=29151 RepID=UPI002E13F80B